MRSVIGFEGTLEESDIISHGAAAIRDTDGSIINSLTRLRLAESELSRGGESVTKFRDPWEIPETAADEPIIVVAIRHSDAPWHSNLVPDLGRLGGCLGKKREKPFAFLFFRDRNSFRLYAEETSARCAEAILREEVHGAEALQLVRSGLTLVPRDPMLLALRVTLSADKEKATRTAELLLRSSDDNTQRQFKSYVAACASPDILYKLKYEDGDQKIGGLNLNVAVKQLNSIELLTKKIRPIVKASHSFVLDDEELPEFRFQHLKAASAELGFGVLGKSLRDRVLRYLELELLGSIFRGNIPPELAGDAEFLSNLHDVMTLPGGASMRHQPIGSDDLEPPAVEFKSEDELLVSDATVSVLGFVQGFFQEVRKAEIRFGVEHVEAVSIEDNGDGFAPSGVEGLRFGRGLFQPVVAKFSRRRFNTGRVRYYLRSILPVDGRSTVDTFPSSVIRRGLFATGDDHAVRYTNGRISLGEMEFPSQASTLDGAKAWLAEWQRHVLEKELEAAENPKSRWYPASETDFALKRVLIAVGGLPIPTTIDRIVQKINAEFEKRVRINNTWRVIRTFAELFRVSEDDGIELTKRGEAWLTVIRRYRDTPA